jgi:hypothetical protein
MVHGWLSFWGWDWDVQALLQMADIPSAINVMQYYTTVQPSVR